MSEQERSLSFLLTLTCELCHGQTPHSQVLHIGENTLAMTCSQCGERWRITCEVVSLVPFRVNDWVMSRVLGRVKDGAYFAKGALQ